MIPQATRFPEKSADEKFCSQCAATLHAMAPFCTRCGAPQGVAQQYGFVAPNPVMAPMPAYNSPGAAPMLPVNHVYCRGCGNAIHQSAVACPKCGAVQSGETAIGGGKSRTSAAILALLLGGLGAHHFYLGNVGLGILYLVFCWTFIPAIAALIEGIMFLSMSDARFAMKYR